MYDVIVIGKGLVGSAAGRYLSQWGFNTAVIGPDEPDNWPTHEGVFASHYDQGRITRVLDPDLIWATLAQRSMAAYGEIERQSGISFHVPAGLLWAVGAPWTPENDVASTEAVGQKLGAPFRRCEDETLACDFPYFVFPQGSAVLHESGPAGYVNPRELAKAQIVCAEKNGATIVRQTAVSLTQQGGDLHVVTDTGEAYRARQVLLATGAFTNMMLSRPLDLRPFARSILMAEVDTTEQERLRHMPALIYTFSQDDAEPMPHIYLLPPIRYPDDKVYIKLGGDFPEMQRFGTNLDAIKTHFHTAGDPLEIERLKVCLHKVMPDLEIVGYATKPCVTTHTAHDYPFVDTLAANLFVAAGGSGASAKSSDEIGHMAAQLVANGRWAYDLPAEYFRAVYL